ncbi:GGDEF domain-containing protein [Solibacillus sp. FSL H8-0538]|uniref:GGDEF domain-containing protein n=1 Tax=Solibacillus sp. FSL H8-0538 TaxID=2921400 RepID=UPI0030F551FF
MRKLRFKLFISLMTFALVLVAVISYVNRQILITNIEAQEAQSRELIEKHILIDMQTVDNAHYYFDKTVSNEMQKELQALKELYDRNNDIESWDLEELSAEHGMDIYILDEKNAVVKTTFKQDLGLNFSECCSVFAKLLDERRADGKYYTDGIDVSTTTGEIRKFSYLATSDHKYLLELGVNLNDVPVFQTFNFVKTANYLIEKYSDLLEVQTINKGGVFLGETGHQRISVVDMPKNFQEHFELAKKTMKPTQYVVDIGDGYKETYRFLPYEAETIRGESSKRIVYIKYGNKTELAALAQNTQQMIFLVVVSLITALILLIVITKILSKTINLATYDPLTGAYNRATYLAKIERLLSKRKENTPGLLLVDLDNFKLANDRFGHAVGDKVLIDTADALAKVIGNNGFVVRLGGDEFGIVVNNVNEQQLERIANAVLRKIRSFKYQTQETDVWAYLSVSMGGAISTDPNEKEIDLYVRADLALYQSKEAGKDQYSMNELVVVME